MFNKTIRVEVCPNVTVIQHQKNKCKNIRYQETTTEDRILKCVAVTVIFRIYNPVMLL
jgi:hypothetical protein